MKKRNKEKKTGRYDKKTSLRERFANSVALPIETLFNLSQMQIVGNREVIIEGYQSILEYDDNLLRVRVKGMSLSFWGSDLQLSYMNDENIVVTGHFEQIEFFAEGHIHTDGKGVTR